MNSFFECTRLHSLRFLSRHWSRVTFTKAWPFSVNLVPMVKWIFPWKREHYHGRYRHDSIFDHGILWEFLFGCHYEELWSIDNVHYIDCTKCNDSVFELCPIWQGVASFYSSRRSFANHSASVVDEERQAGVVLPARILLQFRYTMHTRVTWNSLCWEINHCCRYLQRNESKLRSHQCLVWVTWNMPFTIPTLQVAAWMNLLFTLYKVKRQTTVVPNIETLFLVTPYSTSSCYWICPRLLTSRSLTTPQNVLSSWRMLPFTTQLLLECRALYDLLDGIL